MVLRTFGASKFGLFMGVGMRKVRLALSRVEGPECPEKGSEAKNGEDQSKSKAVSKDADRQLRTDAGVRPLDLAVGESHATAFAMLPGRAVLVCLSAVALGGLVLAFVRRGRPALRLVLAVLVAAPLLYAATFDRGPGGGA